MTDEPQRFTLRPLRYIEPGSDSPWKEVFGEQSDGTHRPQYYSQLELPKILEQIQKDGRIWFPPELAVSRAQKGLWTFTYKGEQVSVSTGEILCGIKVLQEAIQAKTLTSLSLETFLAAGIKSDAFAGLLLETALSASAQVSSIQTLSAAICPVGTVATQASIYCKALYFIFLSSEGKALARAVLKRYITYNASGLVASSTLFEHKKGISAQASGLTQMYLDYIGYGTGFYNYGLYGV